MPPAFRQLHIIASTDPKSGGPVDLLINTANAMIDRGHLVEVVSLDDPNASWIPNFPLKVHALGPSSRKFSYSPKLVPWLKRNSSRYDVAVLHGLWNYSSLGGWRALRAARIPFLIFAHGMLDPWFRATYPVKHILKQIYWTLFEGRVLRDASFVIFTAEEERRLARLSFSGYQYNEAIISLGTTPPPQERRSEDLEAFNAAFPHLHDRRYLLFLSRIHPKKGCDILLSAFARIAAAYPELDLVFAGPDQVGWQSELQLEARRLGLDDRIHWVGMLTGPVKWGCLNGCEAFVLPSHQENFGIAIAEAMASSKPVLITNKINIWREVEASNGGLVANDNSNDFGELLDRYLALEYSARDRMGKNAREGFLKYFDIQTTARELIALCEETKRRDGSPRRKSY